MATVDPERLRQLYDLRSDRHQEYAVSFEGDFDARLRALREQAPVHEGTVSGLLGLPPSDPITGYVENHYACFSWDACNEACRNTEAYSSGIYELAQREAFGRTFKEMDGPEHKRNRELIGHRFVPTQMQWWIDRFIARANDDLVASFEQDGRADLNLRYFSLLPLYTITSSFGVDRETALEYADAFASSRDVWAQRGKAIAVLAPEVAKRRAEPRDDLLSALVHAEIDDGEGGTLRLTDEQVVGVSGVLFTGGIRTTWRQLGALLYALLTHPEQLEAVRADRSLIRNAIEEIMRWSPAVSVIRRTVTRDVELEGFPLPAGSILEISLASANRDPARWPDPDAYDLHRPLRSNMGFIVGPHVCLGMHVARAEMQHAVTAVLERLPGVRLDPDADEPQIIGSDHRGVSALPVVWG